MHDSHPEHEVQAARSRFPRGLAQPRTGFRFAADALLLAAFARPRGRAGLDLGTGCGVVSLALLLLHPQADLVLTGADVNPEMLAAAGQNAGLLGFSGRFRAVRADLGQEEGPGGLRELPPESFDFAVANPPWRPTGHGLVCPDPGRTLARFETGADLAAFARAASWGLKNRGRVHLVHPAERLADLIQALRLARLEPKRLRLVHSRSDGPARLVLLEAVKNAAPGLGAEPPLVLYGQGDRSRTLSPEALAFCPFLGCNPRRSGETPGPVVP